MAMTVKMRTEKTKTEKQRLLISLMRFCPMGSVAGFESFMGFFGNPEFEASQDLKRDREKGELLEKGKTEENGREGLTVQRGGGCGWGCNVDGRSESSQFNFSR